MLNQHQFQKAVALHKQGQHTEAKALYEKLQKSEPKNAHLFHFRGMLAGHQGNIKESIALLETAVSLNSSVPDFYRNLAQAYLKVGDKAKAAYALNGLGNALQMLTKYTEAIAAYDESLKLQPNNAGVIANRVSAQQRMDKSGTAEAGYRKIVTRLKGKAKTINDLMALGIAYQGLGEHDKALTTFRKAIAFQANYSAAHFNAATIHLLNGDFEQGWASWEYRWNADSGYLELARCGFTEPLWTSQTPEELGGPLLVVAEMGFGDIFQFARYVPMLAAKGYDILFEAPRDTVALLAHSFKHQNIRVIPRRYYRWDKWHLGWLARRLGHRLQVAGKTEIYRDLPFAGWVGLMSLPERFATRLETIPNEVPYLSAPPEKVARWRKTLAALPGLKVGLTWSGNIRHPEDYKRSIALESLAPLLEKSGISFISLRKKDAEDQPLPATPNLLDVSADLKDFSDTAALIEALDLVLTVDTAVAHLAGALGKPVWIMIPKVKDWRWMKEGNTSAWYPTARLFRQPVQDEWQAVIEDVGAALDELITPAGNSVPRR